MKIPQPKSQDLPKFLPALYAVNAVENDMKLGLGTGSTAYWFVVLLAFRMKHEALKVRSVTTSSQTLALAQSLDVPISQLGELGVLDLVVDGADEADANLNLIKGGGGALLQEKIVANSSLKMLVIADESKYVENLGRFHLPVEVVKFGWENTKYALGGLLETSDVAAKRIELRQKHGQAFETDERHYILDCYCERIGNARELSFAINQIPGVVENGLFIDLADELILGTSRSHVKRVIAGREVELIDLDIPAYFRENLG